MAIRNETNRTTARRHLLLTALGIVIAIIGGLVLVRDARLISKREDAANLTVKDGLYAPAHWINTNELPMVSSFLSFIVR